MDTIEPLSHKEISLIKATKEKITENSQEIRMSFYNKIFELDPSAKLLFRESFLSIKALPDSIEFMFKHVGNLNEAIPELRKLGLKHKTYKVKPKHYPIAREALLWTFQEYIGNDFTEELREAWIKLFNFMSENLILDSKKKMKLKKLLDLA